MFCNLPNLASWSDTWSAVFSAGYQGVIVACSGGADSTALFHILCEFSKREKNFRLAVGHVNFGLRGEESDLDERFSEDLARSVGAPFNLLKVGPRENAQKVGKSLQEWARDVRRTAFLEWSKRDGFAVAMAHHQDDVAETALLRLARGTSPGTLSGMRVWSDPFWRPLLHEKKSVLRSFLDKNGLPHRVDQSNGRMDYDRNVIRHDVLPKLEMLYPGASERIAACAHEAAEVVRYARTAISATSAFQAGTVAHLRSLPDELAMLSLADSLPKTQTPRPLSRRWLRSVLDAVKRGEEHRVFAVPGGDSLLILEGGELSLSPHDASRKPPRESQHRRSLSFLPWNPLIETGARAEVRIGLEGPSLVASEAQGVESNRPLGP